MEHLIASYLDKDGQKGHAKQLDDQATQRERRARTYGQ